jgi:alkylhydroperoxidase family enzyme
MTRFIPSIKPRAEEIAVRQEGANPNSGIDPALLDLARLRVAQISQSRVGMEKHRLDLETRGESAERLEQLQMWRESALFSDKERAALALGEAVFLDPTKPIFHHHLEEIRRFFEKDELISLLLAIMAVNDWSYSTTPEASARTSPSKTSRIKTHSLPLYWRRLAHQIAERTSNPG